MIQREAKFGTVLRHWLKANPQVSCGLETKQTTKKSIPFNCITEGQIDYLLAIKSDKGVLIRTLGGNSEPDYVYLRNAPAMIPIQYPGEFHLIDVEAFVMERKRSKRSSLTIERARAISTVSVDMKGRHTVN